MTFNQGLKFRGGKNTLSFHGSQSLGGKSCLPSAKLAAHAKRLLTACVLLSSSALFFPAVSPSDNSRTFALSHAWALDASSHKHANGDLRLTPHWRPQSPKSPKSPKVLRLSPQENR